MTTENPLNPESLVARMIQELQENPEAQTMLLRALLTNEFQGMPVRLARIEGMVEQLQTDVAGLKTDVAELKTDVAELKTDVAGLKTDVAGLKTDVAGLKTDVAGLKTDVGDLKGRVMESNLYNFAFGSLTAQLNLRAVELIRGSPATTMPRDFDDAIAENGLSREQRRRVLMTDLIMRGTRIGTGELVYAAVEASYTLDEDDVTRAKESAELLMRVFPGATAIPGVYGTVVPPQVQQAANQDGVLVFQE